MSDSIHGDRHSALAAAKDTRVAPKGNGLHRCRLVLILDKGSHHTEKESSQGRRCTNRESARPECSVYDELS